MGKEHLSRSERLDKFINLDARAGRQIRHLSDMHQQVIALRKSGMTNNEVAKTMGISAEWAKVIRHSWLGEQEADRLDELRDDVTLDMMGKLRRGGELAAEYLMKSLDITTDEGVKLSNMPTLKVKVATDMLDRTPEAAKVTRVQSTKIVAHMTSDDLIRIKERAKANKAAALAAQIEQTEPIDITPEEVQDAQEVH